MKFRLLAIVLIAGVISSATQAMCEDVAKRGDLAQIELTGKPQPELVD